MKTETILSFISMTSVMRYGLALILFGIGLLKFTKHEAEAIRPLAENSPFFSWTFSFLTTRMFSNITGGIEIAIAISIALHPFFPRLSALGSLAAIIIFLIILTFAVSSPSHVHHGLSIPFIPDSLWHFIILHFVLMGISVWTALEAFQLIESKI